MDYEMIELSAKTIIGLTARTANDDPQMGAVIGSLWQRLFAEGIYEQIACKANSHTIGLYSDYEDGARGHYSITVGCEVTEAESLPQAAVVKTIPGGRYAKVTVMGDAVEAVGRAWEELWQLPLERTFTGDFEEYIGEEQIDIYIAVR